MALRLVIRTSPEPLGASGTSARSEAATPMPEAIEYGFDQERVVIGRGPGADVRVPHRSVSVVHAQLQAERDQYSVSDMGSTNGTYVNGQRISTDRPKRLVDGDLITVGSYVFAFHIGRSKAPLITAERTAELARRILRSQRGGAAASSQPRLVVLNGPHTGASVETGDPPLRLLVGRSEQCQLQLSDANVSREHMEVTRDLEGVSIRNLDSANGVRWGERAVHERRLRDGDELVLGATRLLFEDPAEEWMKNLASEADVALAAPPALPLPPVDDGTPVADVPIAPAPVKRKKSAQPTSFADLVIYVFAAAVLALSVAGIAFLLRAD